MFVLKFAHFFRPHRWRLVTAISCLVFVSLLTAIPVFVISEFVEIVGVISKDAGVKPSEQPGLEGAAGKISKHVDKEQIENLRHRLWNTINGWTGGRIEATRAAVKARIDPLKLRYQSIKLRRPMDVLIALVVGFIMITGVKGLAEYMANYQIAHTMLLTTVQIRERILARVLSQDYLFFTKHSPGYLISRIGSDTNRISDMIQTTITSGVQSPLTVIIMFGLLIWLSPALTLYVLVLLPILGGTLYYFARVIRRNQRKRQQKSDQLSGTMTESLTNVRLVKAFGTEKVEEEKFHQRTMNVFKYMIRARVAQYGSSPLMEFICTAGGGAIMIIGCRMIQAGSITPGDALAYVYALSRFYRPIKSVSGLVNKYQASRVGAERMLEMLALEPKLVESANPKPFDKLRRGIELRDLHFSYAADAAPALDGVSFSIRPGQCIGFAGKSGSGKTTLVNMIARLMDPDSGQILIDGVDLREIRMADWRGRLGMVTQETMLFEDTIANNIAYGSPGKVDMERVKRCAAAAHADEFIEPMELGYDAIVGTGGLSLSGGQRQRLAIARALYRDPEILILDEATSALDAESQAKVQEAFDELMHGRTTFVIAHRISTIRHADCILVFDRGRIAERGTHDELLALGGIYASMVTRTGFIDDGADEREAEKKAATARIAEETLELKKAAKHIAPA